MNTLSLGSAGGGAYYVAKKQVNANRQAEYEAQLKRQRLYASFEERESSKPAPSHKKDFHKGSDHSGSPSGEASTDPAPTSHQTNSPKPKSKYEPSEVYRSRKGDRFSSVAVGGSENQS
ncbi:MAG: hypothetical protein LQ340_006956 [Diploschistes diacapsis]|nr:MAG: hypothetical protein LQ340_006956 [Diploschistes diacapsis]